MLLKPKKNLIAVLDVGSSKTVLIVARVFDGKISVIGCSYKLSHGIRNSVIVDIKKAVLSIVNVIEDAEKICGERVDGVYITISGCSLDSHYSSIEILLGNNEIGEREIRAIVNKGYEHFKNDERNTVLHCLPIEYVLDDNQGIVNPIGMYGNALMVKLHIITAHKPSLLNLANCLGRCQVSASGYMAIPYVLGFSCVDDDDKSLGVTIIDIGGGHVSIGSYKDGNLVYINSVPIGGIHITKDIACAFSLSTELAERIKICFGGVDFISENDDDIIDFEAFLAECNLPDSDVIYGSGSGKLPNISRSALNEVLRARVEEILEMVRQRLLIADRAIPIFRKIIITGGVSKTHGMQEFASNFFNASVRIGKQKILHYSDFDISDPVFSVAVGSLLCIRDHFYSADDGMMVDMHAGRAVGLRKWLQKFF